MRDNKTMDFPPIRKIYNIYFRFCGLAGITPDTSPVNNVFIEDKTGKPFIPHEWVSYDERDTSKNVFVPEQIESTFKFDKCASDDEIKKALKEFQEKVLSDPARDWTSLNWTVDSKGRKRDWGKVNTTLEKCIVAYRIGRPLSAIVAELQLAGANANDRELKSADREAKRLLDHATSLVEAAREGFPQFYREAMKPLPRNL